MADKFVGPEKPKKQYFKTAEEKRQETNPWLKEALDKKQNESVVSDKGPVMPESVKKSREKENDYFNTSTNPIAEEIIRDNAPSKSLSSSSGVDASRDAGKLGLKADERSFKSSLNRESFKSRYDDSIIGRLEKINEEEKQKKLEAEKNRSSRISEDFRKKIKSSTFDFSRSNNVFEDGNGLRRSSREDYISSGRLKGDKNAVYDWNDLNDFLKSFQSAVNNAGKGNSFTEIADSNKLAGDAARELHTAIRQFESANGFLPAVFEDIYSDLPRLRDEYYRASTGGASVKGIDADVLARTNDAISQSVNQLYSPVKESKYTIDRGIDRTKLSNMPVSNEVGAKGIHDIAIKDLTDDQIRTLVLNDVFDFEQMKKSGLGELASYIQSRYNNANSSIYRKNPDGSYVKDAGLDRAAMFIRKTGDAARDTLEQYAGGILNAGLSLADIVSDDYRIKSAMDNMDRSADDDYKFEAMPEGQKTAATLLGGTVQILPTIAANIVMPGAGMAVMGTSIYGNSYAEARKNGASEGEAAFNGFLNATAEMLIEKFAGGIPGLGEGATSKYVASVGRFFNSEPAQRIARVLFEAGGEGVEEVLSYFAEPIIDGISLKNPGNWEYSTRNLAMNFLGGFLGSALFGGGVEIVGLKASPSKEAKSTADAAIKKFGSLAYTKGIADEKTQKAAQDAIKAIERIGYYDKENNTYTVPHDIANMLNASELIRKNPNSADSLALNQVYESMKKVVFDDTSEEFKTAVKEGKISRNEVNALRKISSGARVNVNFVAIPEFIDGVKNPDYDYGNFTIDENGAHINININGKDPLFQTALHEIVHALKASDASNCGGRFTILQNNVLQILSEYPDLVNSLDAFTRERYKNVLTGNKASDNAILEDEIIADVLARVLNNRDIIKYYAQRDMGTLQRIFDNIRTFFENSSQRYKSMSKQKNDPYSLAAEKLNEYSESIGEMFKGAVGESLFSADYPIFGHSTKHSIVTLPDNKKFVKASRQIIKGDYIKEWPNDVMRYINNEIRHGKDVVFTGIDGEKLTITRDTAGKARYRNVINEKGGNKRRLNDDEYLLKLRIESHIDEISQVSNGNNKPLEPDKKNHPFAKDGFEYRTAYFEDFDGSYYRVIFSVGHNGQVNTVYNVGQIIPQTYNKTKKRNGTLGRGSMALQYNTAPVTHSSRQSLPHNPEVDNVNNNQIDTDFIDETDGLSFDEEIYSDENLPESPDYYEKDVKNQALIQSRVQAGLDPNALYDESVSLKQSDIDERNGHTFTIPDENALHQQSQYRDKFNNSLHLADSVVFQYNNGVDEVYGTGRILSFYDGSEGGVAKITVDSGDLAQRNIEIDTNRLMFIAHNDTQTIGHDFTSELDIFKKAKPAWDEFVQTGDIGPIMQLHFKDIRYLYGLTNNRISILQNQIKSKVKQYDEGIAFDAVADRLDTKAEREAYSSHAVLAELYHSVRLSNFLKPIYDIHVANGGQAVDIARAIIAAFDYDQGNPIKMVSDKIKSLNRPVTIKGKKYRFDPKDIPKTDFFRRNVFSSGNYMFNTPRANFERTLGPYASVFTSVLDSLEQRGCDYAKAVTEWHASIQEICKKYNVKPGDDFSAAIQMLGEGRFALDMRNKKMKALFERFDLPLDSINTKTGIASGPFNLGHVIHIFGKERAENAVEIVNYFRGAYAEYLKRINETMAYIYPGQPDRLIRPKKDYFRHFIEVSDGLVGLMQTLSSDIQIDPTLVGKTDRTKPKKSWESPFVHRTGDTVYPDAVGGFLEYIPHAEYFININPSIKDFRLLREIFGDVKQGSNDTSANSFINWLDVFTNHLAKKTIGLDRILTDLFPKAGRVILSFAKGANKILSKNQLLMVVSVMTKQIGNIDNAIIYMQNPIGLLNSMFGVATAYTINPELKKKYVELFKLSPFLTQRGLDPDFKLRKAGAEKIAGDMLNLGDDFGCKAIWLACYREGQRLNTPDPVRYADDITRRCVAGRGIGEKPLIFTSELSRLFLPYLLEANNNRSVMRDAAFDLTDNSKGDNFEFDDKNSYLYYNHQKSSGGKFASRSFKAALWLLVTFGVNELLRKIFNQDMDIDLIDDLRAAYKSAFKDDGSFDLSKFAKGSISNISDDFLEHGNFSWVYDLLFALAKDDPTEAVNALNYSVPIISSIASPAKNIARGDYLGAGLDIITSYVTPFGGSQIKKTFNGLWDYYQGANYWHRPTEQLQNWLGHNVLPDDVASKIGWNGSIKGGKAYDIEQTPANFARGLLFGQSAFPENKKYWDAQDAKNKSEAESEKLKESSINYFALSLKDTEFDALYDLWNETENYAALPIKDKIWDNISFENNQDRKFEAVLTDEEKQKYSEMFTEKLKPVYLEIINSDKFKNADVDGKIKLLKDANDAEWKYFNQDYIQSDVMAREYLETYKGKYGDDDLIQLYNASGDAAYLPSFDIYKNLRAYAEDGSEHRTMLTDEQLAYYNEIGVQKVHDAMYGVINSPEWANLTPEQKSDKLRVAKLHAEKEVEEYAQKDFLYKDIITKYNETHGEDDPIRRAYATTHDPEVYPFISFNETLTVQDNNRVDVRFTLSQAAGSYGDDSEFAHFEKYANENFAMNLDRLVQAGYFNNLTDEQIHSKIMDLKNKYVGKALNNVIKNYIREKLGIAYRHQFR